MNYFNNVGIRNKILAVVILVLLLNIGVAVVVYNSVVQSQEREYWVSFTHEIIQKTDELLLQLVNMETGERGFAITGNEVFLEPYNEGLETYNQLMEELKEDVDQNEAQLALLEEIGATVEEWDQVVLQTVIQMRREVNAGNAELSEINDFIAQEVGKERADAIRTKIAQFRQVEEDLLEERDLESQQAATMLKSTLIGGSVAALLIGLVASVLIASSISRRVKLVAQAASGIAQGNHAENYELPEGHDEIGVLSSAFSSMEQTIRQQIEEQRRYNQELEAANSAKVAKEYLEEVVSRYSSFARDVAQGNLSARLSVNGTDDELALLGHDLNRMVESLHAITTQVQQATSDIASSSAEILAATSQQASSAAEQSSAVTQISTTLEEIKTITYKTAKQAEQIAHDSQEAIKIAERGTQSVEDTIAGMQQIRGRVESIAQTILSLSEQTQAIGAITTTVSELADQSNMLALNAAIEAARAGEQGKSFAIVAQHVRELAERSKGATGQVREILEEIQRATNAAVMVTEEGTKGVELGVKQATNAGQVIHEIATEVENESQASVQMATAAQQQTAGIEQIGQAMSAIQQSSTQTLSSTRQAEQAAKDLNALAQSLQNAITAYHL
jgi:methyl-accepting chemotaxis protein